jgi:L-lactate dehydrogenase complex protein LldG
MDQATFLARLRSSRAELSEGETPAEAPSPESPVSEQELADRLARELEAVEGAVHRAGSLAEARERIVDILRAARARRLVRTRSSVLDEIDLDRALFEAGIESTVCDLRDGGSRTAIREADFNAEAGLTGVDYGVAETGTLVLLSRPGEGRAVSLVPPIHIAVLRRRDIVHELGALFERVAAGERGLPSALTFITGPSSTGDIELVHTVGVHGPRALHLVLLS